MFSVVMPVRDKPHTIERTLAGAVAQTRGDFELILVGAPEDPSMAIAARIEDPRLRLIWQPNAGPGPARNAGVEASRHDWIAFLDGDDLWLPDHLAELDKVRRRHPEAALIGTRYVDTDTRGRYAPPPAERGRIGRTCYFAAVGRGENVFYTSSAAVARWAFDAGGGFGSTQMGEDTLLWARIALDHPVVVSSRATVIYVHGTGGIMDSGRDRWRRSPLASAADLSPPVAFLVEAYPRIVDPERRSGVDAYIRRYCHWCLLRSFLDADVETVRRARRIYWGRPDLADAAIMAASFLPDGLARSSYRAAFRVGSLIRRLSRRIASQAPLLSSALATDGSTEAI